MRMTAILGIDAAWTPHQPSGVALVRRADSCIWQCLCVAPSYATFLEASEGHAVSWAAERLPGTEPDVGQLLAAAERLLGGQQVDLVTIDMPVSREPILGRRTADNAVSKAFGAAGCGTHTPNARRPGALGSDLTTAFSDAGYPVATLQDGVGTLARLIEVYPHPALMALQNEVYRLPYKAGKSRKYWPSLNVRQRIERLLTVYRQILASISAEIAGIDLPLPTATTCSSLSSLKRYEDALDALVCAWVGRQYIEGNARPHGDLTAAIWIPTAETRSA